MTIQERLINATNELMEAMDDRDLARTAHWSGKVVELASLLANEGMELVKYTLEILMGDQATELELEVDNTGVDEILEVDFSKLPKAQVVWPVAPGEQV